MYVNRMTYGTRRSGGPPVVLSDGNTVAWFDYFERITKDGSDFVSVWGDKSGNGNDLLQSTGTNQPLWSADDVLFDGVDNFMQTATFPLEQPEMIYVVLKQATWTLNDRLLDGFNNVSAMILQATSTPNIAAAAGIGSGVNGNLPVGTFGIVRVLFDGASSKLIVNETTPVTGNFGADDMDGLTMGAQASAAFYGNIQVKELILRKIADSPIDEQDIYDYLASKYSIS